MSAVRGARVEQDFPLLQDPGPHRPAEPPIFSCVTRTLRRNDKEWYCEAAQQALDDECIKLLARNFVDPTPVDFDSIAQQFPDAVYADVMTILGLKFAELDQSCWKFKARSVLRGDQVKDVLDGESHIFVETASAPSNMETFKSVSVFSEIEGEPATTSDALQAFTQVILQPKDGPEACRPRLGQALANYEEIPQTVFSPAQELVWRPKGIAFVGESPFRCRHRLWMDAAASRADVWKSLRR